MQSLHPDFRTDLHDTEYFFLGAGKYSVALQWSKNKVATPLGMLIWSPEQMPRKWGTHLFHPEYGLDRTMLSVFIDGEKYRPQHEFSKAEWRFSNGIPQICCLWKAGNVRVQEEYSAVTGQPILMRTIRVFAKKPVSVKIECALYANPNLYDSFNAESFGLEATGYSTIRVLSNTGGAPNERFLTIDLGTNTEFTTQLLYELGEEKRHGYTSGELMKATNDEHTYWEKASQIKSNGDEKLEHYAKLFQIASAGLRAVVSDSGRFDASIWQYGMEWGRDAAHVAEALVYSGQFELALKVLENITTRLANDDGMIAEASRFRGGERSELDSNGAVLHAWGVYYEWTDDRDSIRKHWKRIRAIAEYLLREEFYDSTIGFFKATRDMWERGMESGLLPGYDIAHQVYAYLGLYKAVDLAIVNKEQEFATSLLLVSTKIVAEMNLHPTLSFIEDEHIIKRRLLDGSVQTELAPKPGNEFAASFIPSEMPLAQDTKHSLEPDITQALPFVHRISNTEYECATNTMTCIEKLWSQKWDGGGYGRYDISGEPDSPGAWPLATMIAAAAYFEIEDNEKALRALDWVVEKAGRSGSWFEFYGERPTPPLPPTGILVWAWAQYIRLVIKHIVRADVKDDGLHTTLRMEGLTASLRFKDGKS